MSIWGSLKTVSRALMRAYTQTPFSSLSLRDPPCLSFSSCLLPFFSSLAPYPTPSFQRESLLALPPHLYLSPNILLSLPSQTFHLDPQLAHIITQASLSSTSARLRERELLFSRGNRVSNTETNADTAEAKLRRGLRRGKKQRRKWVLSLIVARA